MHTMNNIALLFFSRSSKAEGRKKSWFSGHRPACNKALASSLIQQSSDFLKHSGLPVFHYHEGNQRGKTFGERFANAYQDIFDQGYTGVIAIGNDSPEIVKIDLTEVSSHLLSGKPVLGASLRGGAYLIGITAGVFDKEQFQNLPWQSNKVFTALREMCTTASVHPSILETFRDINSLHDLKFLLRNTRLKEVHHTFIVFLKTRSKRFYRTAHLSIPASFILSDSPLRAPPVLHAFAVRVCPYIRCLNYRQLFCLPTRL